MDNSTISINVGGEVFLTTRSTLMSLPNTLLSDLIDPSIPRHVAFQDNQHLSQVDADESFLPDYRSHKGAKPGRRKCVDRSKYVFVGQSVVNESSFWSNGRSNSIYNNGRTSQNGLYSEPTSRRLVHDGHTAQHNVTHAGLHSDNTNWPYTHNKQIPINCHNQHFSDQPSGFYFTSGNFKPYDPLNSSNSSNSAYEGDVISTCVQKIFIDRNPVLVPYILDAYRLGELHLPSNVCSLSIRAELEFWKIPEDMMSECCWKNFHEGLKTMKIVNSISQSLYSRYDEDRTEINNLSFLGKIWLAMETPSYNWVAKIWCVIYNLCILASIIVFLLLSLSQFREIKPEFQSTVDNRTANNITITVIDMNMFYTNIYVLGAIEHFLRAFFTLEFLIRLLTCPEKKEFIRNIHNIMDMIIVMLMWIRWTLDYIITNNAAKHNDNQSYLLMVFNCLMGVRVLSVFHLTKYSTALKVMYLSIYTVLKELTMLVIILAAAVLIFGTSMYVAENISSTTEEKSVFENIPIAMWWAVVTMTTLGYGDFVPKHLAGYLVGAVCAVTGLLLFAMPIAIVAANFANYYDNITSTAQGLRRKSLIEKFANTLSWKQKKSRQNTNTITTSRSENTNEYLTRSGQSIPLDKACNTISVHFTHTEPGIMPLEDYLPRQNVQMFSTTDFQISKMYQNQITKKSKWKRRIKSRHFVRGSMTENI